MWSIIDRYTRKITCNTGTSKQINIPRNIRNLIDGNTVQFILMEDELKNQLITICGIDDCKKVMSSINKE
jgi:hypothetical protein